MWVRLLFAVVVAQHTLAQTCKSTNALGRCECRSFAGRICNAAKTKVLNCGGCTGGDDVSSCRQTGSEICPLNKCFGGQCRCGFTDCKNGGSCSRSSGGCNCLNGWGGNNNNCDTCTRTTSNCLHGAQINTNKCECECADVCGDHGTGAAPFCACQCDEFWGGEKCDQCTLTADQCLSGGTLDADACACTCTYLGPSEAPNSTAAGNMTSNTTTHLQPTNETQLPICKNEGQASSTCACTCNDGWEGPTCRECSFDPETHCANNGTFLGCGPEPCACDAACANGGTQDERCQCRCPNLWAGELCDRCTSEEGSTCRNNGTFDRPNCACDCSTAVCGPGQALSVPGRATCGCYTPRVSSGRSIRAWGAAGPSSAFLAVMIMNIMLLP